MTGLYGTEKTPWGRIALVWLGICILLVAIHWSDIGALSFLDPDDELRLVQVRDLVSGQAWFDLHQYRINPGASPVMHWSRIVDAPLALSVLMLRPFLGQPVAEHVTVVLVPLLTLLALMAVVGRMAFRLFDKEIAGFACLALGFSPLMLAQFQPLRIDHHAWQIVSVVFAVGALLNRNPRLGGALAGLAIATGLSVSLEVLPFAAAIGGVLLLRWLRDPEQRWWLPSYLSSLAAGLAVLFAATRGFGNLTEYCDVVSPAHFVFFALVALAAVAIAARPGLGRVAVVGLLGVAGAIALAVFVLQAPQCASGPFGNLDPLVRQYWYANVMEGRPIWTQPRVVVVAPLVQALIALCVLFGLWRGSHDAQRTWWLDYFLLFAAALAAGLLVWRSMAFVGALAAVPIAFLLQRLLVRFRTAEGPFTRFAFGLAAIVTVLPATPVVLANIVVPDHTWGPTGQISQSDCKLRQSALALNKFAPTVLFAPVDIGPALLERTPHSVVATGHHRAQLAMRDVIQAFLGPEAQAHAIIRRHHASYLVVCSDLGEPALYANSAPNGFMAQLLEGKAPSWLQPVALDVPPSFHVWQVVG